MIFWMAKAARSLSGELRSQIDKAAEASRWSLVIIALLAVGREGLETALFLWAATQAAAEGTGSAAGPLLGAALGLLVAVVLGYLIYRGALKINLSRFFKWTGAFLIVIAAGVLAYGVHDLQEARFLPGLNNLAFDVSGAIPPTSWYGTLLKGVFNFSPATTVLELTAWLLYFIPTMTIFLYKTRQRAHAPSRPTPERVEASGRK
jgi:high-affinity iron transporter